MRHCDAARCYEIAGCRKVRLSNVGHEVIPEISSIRQIEDLENRLKIGALAKFEVLRYSCIELEERLASQVVKGYKCALPRT